MAPAELKALIGTHRAVADVAVIGAPDGEVPVACVVMRAKASDEQLMVWVAERVSPHKRIRRVVRVDALPRSATGKLLRRQLRGRI